MQVIWNHSEVAIHRMRELYHLLHTPPLPSYHYRPHCLSALQTHGILYAAVNGSAAAPT